MLTTVPPTMISAAVPAVSIRPARLFASLFMGFGLLLTAAAFAPAMAQTAPVAIVSSPASGVVFQDAPRILPVDTRFSQAIQTIAFDVGLTCDQVESYGWTIAPEEQDRVNNIFTQTAQELARLGYSVTPQSPGSAAADITVFTATRPDKSVLFTWSAGNSGLLLLMCDARSFNSGEVTKRGFGPGAVSATSAARANAQESAATHAPSELVGEWAGTYSCLGQGPTGGTLTISRVARDRDGYAISGTFGFYPLKDKNPEVPRGLYRVRGRYDPVHQRAILEPGAWLQHPGDYYNAVMITEFNLDQKRTSGVFQGTTGCTSFEAAYKEGSADRAAAKAVPDEVANDDKPATVKKKTVKKPAARKAVAVPVETPVTMDSIDAAMPVDVPVDAPVIETAPPVTPSVTPTAGPVSTSNGATGSAIPADATAINAPAAAAPAPVTDTAPTAPAMTAPAVAATPIGIPTTTGPGLHDDNNKVDTAGTPAAQQPAPIAVPTAPSAAIR